MKKKMFYGANNLIFQIAKELRSRLTDTEKILWNYLRHCPDGYKFRRQHPIRNYIADFYCHKLKLVIEVDGPIHDNDYNKVLDKERQINIESEGIKVLRFTNDEILRNKENVIEKINTFLSV